MEKTAIIYARVSTVRQADEGLPIESQIDQARRKAEQLDAKIVGIYKDEGISGRTSKRAAFQAAIDACAEGKVTYFITWSSSRFSRNRIDAASYKALLKRYQTRLVYVSCDIDLRSEDSWLPDVMFEVMDEAYSRAISKDTRRSMLQNARDGHFNGGRVPFGFEAVAEGRRKRLKPHSTEAAVVRDMFDLYLSGLGYKEISMRLNALGISKRGIPWEKNTVALVMQNRTCTGNTVFNRESHDHIERPPSEWITVKSHEGIVSYDVFQRAQELAAQRSPIKRKVAPASTIPDVRGGSSRSNAIFTGMLMCGVCGASMQTETATGRSATYRYYNCRAALRGCGCENRRIPQAEFDAWLLDEIIDRIFTVERLTKTIRDLYELKGEWAKNRDERIAFLEAELTTVVRKMGKIFELFELHGKDTPNLGDLTVRLRAHKSNRERLEQEIAEIDAQQAPEINVSEKDVVGLLDLVRDTLAEGNPRKVREFLSGIITTIRLDGDGATLEYRPDRLVNRTGYDTVHREDQNGQIWLPDLDSNQGPAD
ncbi:recombinase family protein [bacterium]|nr:recombinase family protein [bacterium]MBU1978165.1 recombinase family protein [Gammaproteobacteria bacterium]